MIIRALLELIIFVAAAYLIGSIPTGYIIVKLFTGQDIRTVGSGSTGATNVKRVMGKNWFFVVMFLDAFKGALPVLLAKILATTFIHSGLIPVMCAVAAILGHSKSIFLNFTGGKSVASGVGTILALNWAVGLSIAIVWSVVTYISRYVSLGSIVALSMAPVFMFLVHAPIAYVLYCLAGAAYIIYLHRENIQRLLKGTENRVR